MSKAKGKSKAKARKIDPLQLLGLALAAVGAYGVLSMNDELQKLKKSAKSSTANALVKYGKAAAEEAFGTLWDEAKELAYDAAIKRFVPFLK